MMAEADESSQLGEEIDAVIRDFEEFGAASFQVPEEADLFDGLMNYLRKHNAYTTTTVDEENRCVTVSKRPFGTLELG